MSVYPTPLLKLDNFWGKHGQFVAFVKDESKNPYGTVKDRRNAALMKKANNMRVDKLALITSGNNGFSLAKLAEPYGIKVVCVINKEAPEFIKAPLKQTAHHVIELNLDSKILRPEEIISFARETDDEVIWDATNGFDEYYEPILQEIIHVIKPSYIVVPVGSGGLFVGLAEAVERFELPTRIIGIGVQNTLQSFADKLFTPWSPYTKAVEAYQKMGHIIIRLTEQEIKKTYQTFKNVVNCEPSSSIVFAAPEKIHFLKKDKVVFVNSGTTSGAIYQNH